MTLDAWLPIGFAFPDGATSRIGLFAGRDWQIVRTRGDGLALVAHDELAARWLESGLIEPAVLTSFQFGARRLWATSCGPSQIICPVADGRSPDTKAEALAFALALKATRSIDAESPLQDGLYVEKISRVLPTYGISSRTDDDVVLGYWLTGGAGVSVKSFRRLRQAMSWLGAQHLKDVIVAAGFPVDEVIPAEQSRSAPATQEAAREDRKEPQRTPLGSNDTVKLFELAGRPELAAFFNEHVVDIVQHRDRYGALGIGFPSAIVLHGPPGCGKTFAVDRLVDFLGWPSFQIDASSVASPYIHDTSKKIAEVFEKAMQNAPSVLVIDEMEAFLADREMGSGHHRVEEVAEFLRRIPEAVKREVLIVAMTNRVEMIDPAILRRGRFDHVVKVDFAGESEVRSLLESLLSNLPKSDDVDLRPFARDLAGRPLSDVAFVVREGARLAAKSGKGQLDQASLSTALEAAPAREREGAERRRIGFV
jgi:SpoVK/Ycf46/Vps4 family AAA+-type ATPase